MFFFHSISPSIPFHCPDFFHPDICFVLMFVKKWYLKIQRFFLHFEKITICYFASFSSCGVKEMSDRCCLLKNNIKFKNFILKIFIKKGDNKKIMKIG